MLKRGLKELKSSSEYLIGEEYTLPSPGKVRGGSEWRKIPHILFLILCLLAMALCAHYLSEKTALSTHDGSGRLLLNQQFEQQGLVKSSQDDIDILASRV